MAFTQFQQFAGVIWLFVIFIAYFYDKTELTALNSILGIWLGLELAEQSFIFMLFMFVANLYLLYDVIFNKV